SILLRLLLLATSLPFCHRFGGAGRGRGPESVAVDVPQRLGCGRPTSLRQLEQNGVPLFLRRNRIEDRLHRRPFLILPPRQAPHLRRPRVRPVPAPHRPVLGPAIPHPRLQTPHPLLARLKLPRRVPAAPQLILQQQFTFVHPHRVFPGCPFDEDFGRRVVAVTI